jgi:DTW domain-containing protein YfiP
VALAPHRCPRCRFPTPGCLCPQIPRIENQVEVIFLRHYSERDRLTNTGNWASLALGRSRVLEQGVPGEVLDASELDAPGTWLLYPSPHPPPPGTPPPRRIVVPDATWAQARRIVHRIPAIQRLPRLPLPPAPAAGTCAGLRRPPRRGVGLGGMSTIEAVSAALRVLGEVEAADRLDLLVADGVGLVTRLRGVPEAHASAASLTGPPRALGGGRR